VVFDDVLGMGAMAEELRRQGKPVVGGSTYTDRLEDDRGFGQQELKAAGVSIISQENFTSFDDAVAYVQSNPNRYVIKPSGEAQNIKRLLFVGEEDDGRDVIQVLQDYKRFWSDKMTEFQLQKRIMGVEVAVGAFFNGREFVTPVCVNFEHKKLFPGDIGPATGEMGTSMFWSDPNKLFNATLKKMEAKLAEARYSSYIDINCIVNNNGIYPLEFTSRFGYPAISIQQEGLLTPMGELLRELAAGTTTSLRARSGFQIGVRIVVPPFPYNDPETLENTSKDSVILFKTPSREGVHIEDVRTADGEWLVTGTSGVVLIVCGAGPTMRQAQRQAYNRVRNIMIVVTSPPLALGRALPVRASRRGAAARAADGPVRGALRARHRQHAARPVVLRAARRALGQPQRGRALLVLRAGRPHRVRTVPPRPQAALDRAPFAAARQLHVRRPAVAAVVRGGRVIVGGFHDPRGVGRSHAFG
jgi:phosphoribosylamine--glycine ligase